MKNKSHDILNTASVLFAENGIKKTAIDLICHHCGISKKTFYRYFIDKETIVHDIVKMTLLNTEKHIDKLKSTTPQVPTQLISFFNVIQGSATVFTPVFIKDLMKFYPQVHHLVLESKNKKFLPFLIQNLRQGISEGYYRKSLDPDITAALYFRQLDFVLEDQIRLSDKFTFLSYVNSFFLHGILSQTGPKIRVPPP